MPMTRRLPLLDVSWLGANGHWYHKDVDSEDELPPSYHRSGVRFIGLRYIVTREAIEKAMRERGWVS